MNEKKRYAFLEKLNRAGISDEAKIQGATVEALLQIPGVTIEELKEFVSLKNAIKDKKLMSWLFPDTVPVKAPALSQGPVTSDKEDDR